MRIIVVLGPTSTGKTDLALQLASKFQGELVSADSRQIYKGLDIGTGKLPGSGGWEVRRGNQKWEVGGIKIWMYDVVDPKRQYTVYDYVKDANKVIGDIRERGKLPIIVGGTGFYLKALLEGLPNLVVPVDLKLRKELEKLSLQQLQKKLQELSPDKWEKMNTSDRQNSRRLVRAIEIETMKQSGITSSVIPANAGIQLSKRSEDNSPRLLEKSSSELDSRLRGNDSKDVLKIGLTAPRQILYQRIDERVVSRISQGMIEEVRNLHKSGLTLKRIRQLGLEYGVLADFLQSRIKTEDELIKIMQGRIHGFARRQITWFKNPSTSSGYIYWFDITDKHFPNNVEKVITKWYYQITDVTKD